MGCLTVIVFLFNLGLSISVDAMCFGISMGLGAGTGLEVWIADIGIILDNIAFLLGYALSVEVTFAPRDFWRLSSFQVLLKKISCAWGAKAVVWALWFFPCLAL